MNKKHYLGAGAVWFGPLVQGRRDIIEVLLLPLYHKYAEEAADGLPGFFSLYDPYGPAFIEKNDNQALIVSELRLLIAQFRKNQAIRSELRKFRAFIIQSNKVAESIIMMTPYPDVFLQGSGNDE